MMDEPLSAYIRRVNADHRDQEYIAKRVEAMEQRFTACEPRGECLVCGGERDHVDTCEVGSLSARLATMHTALRECREAHARNTAIGDALWKLDQAVEAVLLGSAQLGVLDEVRGNVWATYSTASDYLKARERAEKGGDA